MEACELIVCGDKADWLVKRKTGIGASDAAAVLNVSPWKGPVDLWGEKVGIIEPGDEETEAMKWGLRLEDAIADAYAEETDRLVVNPGRWTIARSTAHPFMLATLDREIVPIDERGPGLLEIKTASFFKKDDWADEPPLAYQIQLQHQLAVKGYQWGSLAVLLGGQRFLRIDMDRNEEFIARLILHEAAFWQLVQKEEAPAIDGSEGAKELLARLYPKETPGKSVALPAEAVTWHQNLATAKDELKRLTADAQTWKNMLAEAMGDAETGYLPNADAYTYKRVEKKEYTVAAQAYRELRFKPAKVKK